MFTAHKRASASLLFGGVPNLLSLRLCRRITRMPLSCGPLQTLDSVLRTGTKTDTVENSAAGGLPVTVGKIGGGKGTRTRGLLPANEGQPPEGLALSFQQVRKDSLLSITYCPSRIPRMPHAKVLRNSCIYQHCIQEHSLVSTSRMQSQSIITCSFNLMSWPKPVNCSYLTGKQPW